MAPKFTDPVYEKFNPESGHWYDTAGRVVSQVPDARGAKLVTPTVRHMAKFCLVPSVTAIKGQCRAEGLEQWKRYQLLLSALTLPRHPNEPDDVFAVRVIEDWQEQGAKAADAGTAMHAAINRYYSEATLPDTEAACNAVHWIDEWLRGLGATDIKGEFGFCVPGQYGGTIDLLFRVGPISFYVDFKTCEEKVLDGYTPYPEYGWQLAGYGQGTSGLPSDRYFNIGIGRTSGRCVPYEWDCDDMRANFRAFNLLLQLWQVRNRRWLSNGSGAAENTTQEPSREAASK